MLSKVLRKLNKPEADQGGEQASPAPRLFLVNVLVGVSVTQLFSKIMNKTHLEEVTNLESRRQAPRGPRRDASARNWVSMLGLSEFHPTGADLVLLGGPDDCFGPEDGFGPAGGGMDAIIPLSLVLGNILPRICVNAEIFVTYFARHNIPAANSIQGGFASLAVDPYCRALITAKNLSPKLPESMVLLLDNNHHIMWSPMSPCTIRNHAEPYDRPYCIHHEHLEIVADADMDDWMDAHLAAQYDANRANHIRTEIVPSIRAFWAVLHSWAAISEQVPQLFFAHVRRS